MRWARAVALAMLMCSVIGVAILHGLRTDLSPVGNRLSEYANGSHGWLMALVFSSLGVGLIFLGVAFRATMRSDRHLVTVLIPAAAFVAGIAAIVSGIFRTGVSATSEVIHSRASALATCAIVAIALAYSWPAMRKRVGAAPDPVGMALAAIAAGAALLSPLLHETRWTGISQRLLWFLLFAWLLWTAWHLPTDRESPAPPAVGGEANRVRR